MKLECILSCKVVDPGSPLNMTKFQPKEPCLTPTLMDEGQARNPNTIYNGCKMKFWKFA